MKFLKLKLIVFAVILFAAGSAFASYSYEITVNTSSVAGGTGYLYMDYANFGGAASTATITNFTSNATLAPSNDTNSADGVINSTGVSGVLPGNVTFNNTSGSNYYMDYLHQVTSFGNTLEFLVSFSGAALTAASSTSLLSTFSLTFITNTTTWNPLLSGVGANGETIDVNLYNGGATSVETYGGPVGSETPIPPAVLLFGSGLLGLVGIRGRLTN